MKKLISGLLYSVIAVAAMPAIAMAHVIVTPGQAGVGQELTFNVSVPNERSSSVSSVRLQIPKGVSEVIPTVLPGWNIATTGSGDTVTAITWTGDIPIGQREDFSFSAQVPATATQIDWKAYQTYADGTVVHWDQTPAGSDDATGNAGPYSVTKVVNDLANQPSTKSSTGQVALILSIVALFISLGGLFIHRRTV